MLKDLTVVLNIVGLAQALILASLLWQSVGKWRTSNRFLAVVLLSFAVVIINTVVRLTGYKILFHKYEFFANACVLLVAPSLYFYVKFRIREMNKSDILFHYIPFLLYSAVLLILFLLGPNFKTDLQIWERIGLVSFHLQFGIYLYFTYSQIRQLPTSSFSDDQEQLRNWLWMKKLLIAISVAWLLALTFFLVEHFIHLLPDLLTLNVSLIFVLIVGQLAYKSYRLPNLFIASTNSSQADLPSHTQLEIKQKLISALEEEQMYLNPSLSMHDLAKHCQLSARQLSQYLNQYKQVHFFDYINTFRVEHLKRLLTSPGNEKYTIQALAEQSGFRSISTTYTAFKKKVGKTPAQFKKEQNE